MLDKKQKDRIVAKFKTHAKDTGSPEVQIAILTAEIKELTEHLKIHKKDFSSRRGLIKKVSQRRKLLHYLQRENGESYEKLIKQLKIKRRNQTTMMPLEDMEVFEAEAAVEEETAPEAEV
ncbi:MAG: 30S ribosomal protein S15 [Candidatus Komeilibacteria bacterium RIFCSPLOWO2_02_FULL_48_11]|uniref:Small ribosomal subunit protein uS15 n=1 Tax=Candidatus Komeilibacteria bacterium RIFCSPLOWO2_02_FULL_48_11 TaxID=1798553 RepID=A0A1G2BRW4_9BACT|nr:MAG: 30S ribosomal protein S15 [Candidatus Komeilibacteria bacterium RIFCSPLOWO2_02_FULL_48_11]